VQDTPVNKKMNSIAQNVKIVIMQYLTLRDLICTARITCKEWHKKLLLSRCYKPERLSQLPMRLFVSLIAYHFTSVACSQVFFKLLPPSYMQQFNFVHFNALAHGIWDCQDMSSAFYLWFLANPRLFRLEHIKEVVLLNGDYKTLIRFSHIFPRSEKWTILRPRENNMYDYDEVITFTSVKEIVLVYSWWEQITVTYDDRNKCFVHESKIRKRLFADVPKDCLCMIMRYLSLHDVLIMRSLAHSVSQLIPLNECYKPDRLSQLPLTLFKSLLACELLPSKLSTNYLQQFPLKYFESLAHGTWDCRDLPHHFYVFAVTTDHSFQLENIGQVICDGGGSLRYFDRLLRFFPKSTKWVIHDLDPTVTFNINCVIIRLSSIKEISIRDANGEIVWNRAQISELFKISRLTP
jgi:hypothetical protein